MDGIPKIEQGQNGNECVNISLKGIRIKETPHFSSSQTQLPISTPLNFSFLLIKEFQGVFEVIWGRKAT